MRDDPFVAVRSILDNTARNWCSEEEKYWEEINHLRSVMEEILKIDEDDKGNGLRLAKHLAAKSLEKTL